LATVIDLTPLRRGITNQNLDRVYGALSDRQKADLRRRMWHHLLLMVCEIAHAPRKIHRTNWRDFFFMPMKTQALKLILDSRATILATGHFGNFEIAGYVCGLLGFPTTTLARPLDNPFIDRYITRFRSLNGQFMLPKDGSANKVQQLLDSGGTLAVLADQFAGSKGVWVESFGYPTSCHKALALFVLSARAPMLVNYTRRLDRPLRFEMSYTGVADPRLLDAEQPPEYLESVISLTEWYNARMEAAIRTAPEQYWWLHRRWRIIPPRQAKRLEQRKRQKARQQAA
jgi:KDO2-lipid IV(A) lauroyltransferase